ncbi:MAG: cysteine hydrolase [Nitrospirae bacterium]|nr:cysteine hydrolase [Nitrospirota bacterium]
MSLKNKALIAVTVIIAIIAVYSFVMIRKIYTPTTGDKIGTYAHPAKALLVIDVQEDYTGAKSKTPLFKNVDGQIAAINGLIDTASKSGMQVVYIRQLFDNNLMTRRFIGRTIEGLPGAELDSRIKVINDNDFTKKISDAFSNPRLDDFLRSRQVDELYLTGLDGVYCVHKTALGGMNRGYKVAVVTDAVMSQKKMPEVLKLYEKDGIGKITSDQLLAM